MRAISVLVTASLVAACAPTRVGSWRADGAGVGDAVDPATRVAEPRGARYDDHDRNRLDDGDEVVGCLGQAAVIGGVAAVIYLTRFRRGGGGGGDGELAAEVRAPAPVASAPVASALPVAGTALAPAAAAIVEADVVGDGALRPCGAVCGEAHPAAAVAP